LGAQLRSLPFLLLLRKWSGTPSAPVLRRSEVIASEQVLVRDLIGEFDDPDIGLVRQPKPAARSARTSARIQGPAPRIGEHSAPILAELGLEAAEIDRLASEKIVRLVKSLSLSFQAYPIVSALSLSGLSPVFGLAHSVLLPSSA
jgi:hypothetical protein